MSEEWKEVPLGSCYDLVSERYDSMNLPPEEAYLGLEHLDSAVPVALTGGKVADVSGQVTAFRPSDTLFGRLRPYLRKVSYAAVAGFGSTEILVLRPRTEVVLPRFLHLLASSESVIKEAVEKSAGSRMPRTSASDLAAIPVALPPLSVQRRIVDLMERLDNQVDQDAALLATARQVSAALASHIWAVASEQGTPRALDEVTQTIKNGVMYKRGTASGGIPVTRIQTISQGVVDVSKTGSEGFTELTAADFLLGEGDILFSNKNSLDRVGTTAIVRPGDLPLINGDNLLQIRVVDAVDPYYILALLRSREMRRLIRSITRPAVNQASVNAKQVKALPVPQVPEAEQAHLGASYRAALELEDFAERQLAACTRLRCSLLSALLTRAVDISTRYDELLGVAS